MSLKCYFDSYYHFSMIKQLLDFKRFALDDAEGIKVLLFVRTLHTVLNFFA